MSVMLWTEYENTGPSSVNNKVESLVARRMMHTESIPFISLFVFVYLTSLTCDTIGPLFSSAFIPFTVVPLKYIAMPIVLGSGLNIKSYSDSSPSSRSVELLSLFWIILKCSWTGCCGGGRYGGGHYGGGRYGGGRYGGAFQFRVDVTAEPPDTHISTLPWTLRRVGVRVRVLRVRVRVRVRIRLRVRLGLGLGLGLGLWLRRSSAVAAMVICEYLVAPP